MKAILGSAVAALCLLMVYVTQANASSVGTTESTVVSSPEVSVDLWREYPGAGFTTQVRTLRTAAVFIDHIFVQNNGSVPVENIRTRNYWSSPSLVYIGWAGVGANADAWTLETVDASNFTATYAPELGIESGGVGEMIIIFQVKDHSNWPVFLAPQQAQADHVVVLDSTGKQILSALVPQAQLASPIVLETEVSENRFAAHWTIDGLRTPVFSANIKKVPFTFTEVQPKAWPQITNYGNAGNCDPNISANKTTGQVVVVLRASGCPGDGYYVYLIPERAKGEVIPRAGISIKPSQGWTAYAAPDETTYELLLEIQSRILLKIPKDQGVELTYLNERGEKVKDQFWFDGTNWLRAQRLPLEHSKFLSVKDFHSVTIPAVGPVIFSAFPYRY